LMINEQVIHIRDYLALVDPLQRTLA
jgi:hypothetical protein